jgi:hypothetical protein
LAPPLGFNTCRHTLKLHSTHSTSSMASILSQEAHRRCYHAVSGATTRVVRSSRWYHRGSLTSIDFGSDPPSPSSLAASTSTFRTFPAIQCTEYSDRIAIITRINAAKSIGISKRWVANQSTPPHTKPSSFYEEYEGLKARRNKSIIMNPEGLGQHILPGNYVTRKNEKTGVERKVFLEHAHGYFWALKVR